MKTKHLTWMGVDTRIPHTTKNRLLKRLAQLQTNYAVVCCTERMLRGRGRHTRDPNWVSPRLARPKLNIVRPCESLREARNLASSLQEGTLRERVTPIMRSFFVLFAKSAHTQVEQFII